MKQIIHFYTFFRGLKSTLHFLWRACYTVNSGGGELIHSLGKRLVDVAKSQMLPIWQQSAMSFYLPDNSYLVILLM